METPTNRLGHRWVVAFMIAVIVVSVPFWFVTRDRLPSISQLATGHSGGVFYEIGKHLSRHYEEESHHQLKALETEGSAENQKLLLAGKVEAAVLQGDFINTRHLSVIAPLYLEMLHVVVRADSGITNVNDLAGHRVILGQAGSGMRKSAQTILEHYRLTDKIEEVEGKYFTALLDDETIDAAFVTTGILNHDLEMLAQSERIRMLPLHVAAIERKYPFFYAASIPAGLYNERPSVPARDIETVGTTAYLVARKGASDRFVKALLTALHEEGISTEFPNLIPYHRAFDMTPVPMHPSARQYFKPPDHLGFFTNVLESLAAIKELLLALVAGAWLLWDRWKRQQAAEREKMLAAQKDYLDSFLERTLDIEAAQMESTDPKELEGHLESVTRIKLEALRELTHEDLRSDRAFVIFLTQCANLINKIQYKLLDAHQRERDEGKKRTSRKKTVPKKATRKRGRRPD
ncbi:MAG: TAXI family TRAP transporter solute-binding subunit [Limisphaerales bacterium]